MGGPGKTATTGDPYELSDALKDYATVVAGLATAVGIAATVPEPASPVLLGVAAGMAIGAALAYGAGAIADSTGH